MQKPQWHSLEMLPFFLEISREQLQGSREQLKNFEECRHKPHVLDDHIIDRVIKVFSEQNDSVWVLVEQCNRWGKKALDAQQIKDTIEIKNNVRELTLNNEKILELAKYFRNHTVNRILEKDDFELGVYSLLNKA